MVIWDTRQACRRTRVKLGSDLGYIGGDDRLVTSQQSATCLDVAKWEAEVSRGISYRRRDAPYMVWEVITAYTSPMGSGTSWCLTSPTPHGGKRYPWLS